MTVQRLAVEAAIVIGGAVLAAWIVGQSPGLREWIARQWGQAGARCDCAGR
jgi:hypothetical protein